jgi:hypothetical protein
METDLLFEPFAPPHARQFSPLFTLLPMPLIRPPFPCYAGLPNDTIQLRSCQRDITVIDIYASTYKEKNISVFKHTSVGKKKNRLNDTPE